MADKRSGDLILNARVAMKSYQAVKVDAGVQGASSHELIQMLLDGLTERIAQAKGAMQQKNFEAKGDRINSASQIILALRDYLDIEKGGELAQNLDALYEYLLRRVFEAHLKNDQAILDECAELVENISSGWRDMSAGV